MKSIIDNSNALDWDLDFKFEMANQALTSQDYNQAIKIIEEGLILAQNNDIWFNKFRELKSQINEIGERNSSNQMEENNLKGDLTKIKRIGPSTAKLLKNSGINTAEVLLKSSISELANIKGIGEKKAPILLENAKEFMSKLKNSNDYDDEKSNSVEQLHKQDVLSEDIGDTNINELIDSKNDVINKNHIESLDKNLLQGENSQINQEFSNLTIEDKIEKTNLQTDASKLIKNNTFSTNHLNKENNKIEKPSEEKLIQYLYEYGYTPFKNLFINYKYILAAKCHKLSINQQIITILPIVTNKGTLNSIKSYEPNENPNYDQDSHNNIYEEIETLSHLKDEILYNIIGYDQIFYLLQSYLKDSIEYIQTDVAPDFDLILHSKSIKYIVSINPVYLIKRQTSPLEYKKLKHIFKEFELEYVHLEDVPDYLSRIDQIEEKPLKEEILSKNIDEDLKDLQDKFFRRIQFYSIPIFVLGILHFTLILFDNLLVIYTLIALTIPSILLYLLLLAYAYIKHKSKLDEIINENRTQKSIKTLDPEIMNNFQEIDTIKSIDNNKIREDSLENLNDIINSSKNAPDYDSKSNLRFKDILKPQKESKIKNSDAKYHELNLRDKLVNKYLKLLSD